MQAEAWAALVAGGWEQEERVLGPHRWRSDGRLLHGALYLVEAASRKVPPPGRQVKAPYFSLPAEPPTQAPAPWGAGH